VGWENLVLGGHHAFGEAFADFQRELKALRNRGVVLAIASKNEETIALEAIAKHPEMVLKKEDFAAWRINWNDKAANIADLVVELNLGMDSVVFLDDNPAERNRVREALPQVLVPDLPEDKMLFASLIRKLDCFDSAGVSEADRSRTQMYQSQREREALRAGAQSFEDWLEQLQTRLFFEPLNEANQDRALQLLNKTNQMNLSTRRLSDSELKAWVGDPQNHFWTLRVTDRFGDAGLVGLMSLAAAGKQGQITDFILSCRVMGRRIEEAMLRQLLLYAEDLGIDRVVAEFLPTAKNAPCLKFFEGAGGDREGNRFAWQSNGASAAPTYLVVQEALA
jgi:FkbH-like protein